MAALELAGAPVQDLEAFLTAAAQKDLLRLVVVGSVDDGKSTLIGRLLYETGALYDDQVSQVRRASKPAAGEIDFSLFTDGLKSEREQGITIDVAYRHLSTPRRRMIIADTPGHVQYTRNMATGASTAEVGVILLDARLGVLAQSRRHAYVGSLLGLRHLAVAVNKMDLVDFDESIFRELEAEFRAFAEPLGFESVRFFPVSARAGDNVVHPSARTPWHHGGTLLEFLETVPLATDQQEQPLRFPVQYVLRPHLDYRGFAGQVAAGRVRVGDEVTVLPSGRTTRIRSIDTFHGPLDEASAGMSITLRLEDEVDVGRGDVLVDPRRTPAPRTEVDAMLVWLNGKPLAATRTYLLKHTTRQVPAEVTEIAWRLDLETLAHHPADELGLNDIARVHLSLRRPIFADAYEDVPATGAFILVDALTNDTVAAGMLTSDTSASTARAVEQNAPASLVTPAERTARLGQSGTIISVEASDVLTRALERALFDAGLVTALAPTPESAVACSEAGLVSIVRVPEEFGPAAALKQTLRLSGHPVLELGGHLTEARLVRMALEWLKPRARRSGA